MNTYNIKQKLNNIYLYIYINIILFIYYDICSTENLVLIPSVV